MWEGFGVVGWKDSYVQMFLIVLLHQYTSMTMDPVRLVFWSRDGVGLSLAQQMKVLV